LRRRSGDRTVPIHASAATDGIGPCDLVIIATKAFEVEAAAQSCVPLLGPETIVQTIQNGLGSPEIAAPILGADRLAVGVVGGFGASIRAPGHAHHNGTKMIRFGNGAILRLGKPFGIATPVNETVVGIHQGPRTPDARK
jgi:2-dehydropantoate 2-reductase